MPIYLKWYIKRECKFWQNLFPLHFLVSKGNIFLGYHHILKCLFCFTQIGSQFELHQTIRTHNPQSVVPLEMEGKHYLVFAEKLNMTSVWKYDRRQLQFKRHHELVTAYILKHCDHLYWLQSWTNWLGHPTPLFIAGYKITPQNIRLLFLHNIVKGIRISSLSF